MSSVGERKGTEVAWKKNMGRAVRARSGNPSAPWQAPDSQAAFPKCCQPKQGFAGRVCIGFTLLELFA